MTRILSRTLCLLSLCLFAALAFAGDGDETLENFKKFFKTYDNTPTRVEAVLTLEGIEEPAVVQLVLPLLKDPDSEVVRASVRVLAAFKTRPPIDALLAALKSDKTEATRAGILRAFTDGKVADVGPAVTACLADKSWEVRRRAIQALACLADPAQAPVIAPLCADPEVAVRCEAIELLTRLKSDLVVPHAISSLNDPVWQVRTSAINALLKIRSRDAVEPLILRLAKEEGRLVPEIGEALANLTGKEFGSDVAKWQQFWAENKDKFVLPSPEAIEYMRGLGKPAPDGARAGEFFTRTRVKARPEYEKTTVANYHGIDTPSRSIMFVIDVSGSMETDVTEKDRFLEGKYPSFSRIDIVKTELQRTIDHLESFVNFNILAFATDIDPWKKKLVAANVLNKSAAKQWAGGLIAIGGSSKEDLAQAGLMGAANLEKGKTNTYGALMAALNVTGGPKTGDKNYTTDVDTIFFLSDGRPTVGTFVDPDDILREVNTANSLRKVVIHTIAIGEFQKDFMRKIAEQNGGVFVDLGK